MSKRLVVQLRLDEGTDVPQHIAQWIEALVGGLEVPHEDATGDVSGNDAPSIVAGLLAAGAEAAFRVRSQLLRPVPPIAAELSDPLVRQRDVDVVLEAIVRRSHFLRLLESVEEQKRQKFYSDVVSNAQLAGTKVLRDDTGWFSKSRNEQYTQIVSTAKQLVPGITDAEIEALGNRNDNVSIAEVLTLCFTKNPSLKTDPIGIIRILSGNDPNEMAKIKDEQSALNWIKRFGKERR